MTTFFFMYHNLFRHGTKYIYNILSSSKDSNLILILPIKQVMTSLNLIIDSQKFSRINNLFCRNNIKIIFEVVRKF